MQGSGAFCEREFYLSEFHGRTLAIAVPAAELRSAGPLAEVLDPLVEAGARLILISEAGGSLGKWVDGRLLPCDAPRLEGDVWRALGRMPRLGLRVEAGTPLAAAARAAALRLGVFKLVLVDREGGLRRPDGSRWSFLHAEELRAMLATADEGLARASLLREVEATLAGGVPAVNLCSLAGLAHELFTYAGSGTLFTRERYVQVRRLGIDDFDAAADLIARGVEEGFLLARSPEELDRVLASGFGAFVEGSHLAGIGALVAYPESHAGEIVSLYALTRFSGEGIGAHLVGFALERARAAGWRRVFACSRSARVGRFFERQGFERVDAGALPPAKWQSYDARRREQLACFCRALGPEA